MAEMTPDQIKQALEGGRPVTVLDIREADEFSAWHIDGSRNLPIYEALRDGDTTALLSSFDDLPRDRPVVTVCKGGVLSQRAATLMRAAGIDAKSLAGGMRGWGRVWSEAGLPGLPDGVAGSQILRHGKGCLSYLISAGDEAVAIDPSLDVEVYTGLASSRGVRISHVLETHVHADHASRARELCSATGAALVMPENDRVRFAYTPVREGDVVRLGDAEIRVLSTPGHTSESCCYLIGDSAILTGDTLFVDAVGRPDLERGDAGAETGAEALFESLHRALFELPRDVLVCPCHHGSPFRFDGKPVAATLGDIRERLPVLSTERQTFVSTILSSLQEKPNNFSTLLALNEGRADPESVDLDELEAGPNRCAAG